MIVPQSTTILVVDDEPGIRESCRRVLSSEGFTVETAGDGLEGFDLFQKNRSGYAAVLIDLKMPRMGGIELIEKIRSIDHDTLLLVITAYATIETAVEATKLGAYDYIPKPFTPEELMLSVRNGLEARALALEASHLRREREQRLLEVAYERSQSATIIECMADGVVVVNREGQIVLRNAAASRIVPWRSSDKPPCPLESLDCEELRRMLQETVRPSSQPGIVSREVSIGASTYMVSTSPVIDNAGSVLGGLIVLRDVTALKELAVSKSMFVSMIAHELKSPLAAVEGYLNLVLNPQTGGDPEQNKVMLERSLLRAQTLRQLVDELLSLRAMETGNFTITRTPLNLGEVIQGVVDLCRERAAAKHITLSAELHKAAGHQRVLADKNALQRVFTNLIENAIKYTPEGGHVAVEAAPADDRMTVAVRDDGIGIEPVEQEKVFDEFYRVRNRLTASIPGTGLGLSLVKNLLDMHNAKISVQSAPGSGSTFTVSLPLLKHPEGPAVPHAS